LPGKFRKLDKPESGSLRKGSTKSGKLQRYKMGFYQSSDMKSSLDITKVWEASSNGGNDVGFRIQATSHGFSSLLPEVYFDSVVLCDFIESVDRVVSYKLPRVELQAISEFRLVIEPADSHGHFALKITMQRLFYSISSFLIVELETQSVLNLVNELKEASKN
jgi:hypothetical protein